MDSDSEIWADDFMGRKSSADFLTTYLLANAHIKVLNVNSPWGAGKSFFMSRWAKDLEKNHICISFNAWNADYSSEPLVSLIACIEQQVSDPNAFANTEVGASIINTGSKLVKKAAPLILKGLLRKISGVELDEVFSAGSEAVVDNMVQSLIEEQAQTENNVNEFKKEVGSRLKAAAKEKEKLVPAFIFIDELDRCRPTYAIELLERIKHFFELEDCRFIIASDSEQLAHSIRAVYGQGFSSERYLNRFFDAEFVLDNTDIFAMVHANLPSIDSVPLGVNVTGNTTRSMSGSGTFIPVQEVTVVCNLAGFTENGILLVVLCRAFKVELRDLINYINQIKAASDAIEGKIHFFWLAFLVFFKASKIDGYSNILVKGAGDHIVMPLQKKLSVNVNVSCVGALPSFYDIVRFYVLILTEERSVLKPTLDRAAPWQEAIYYGNSESISKLKGYKNIVDLASRLS